MNRKSCSGAVAGCRAEPSLRCFSARSCSRSYIAPALADSCKSAQAPANPAALRIGTYDSRAVAAAYARSEKFAQKMTDPHRQRSEAEKAGDKNLIAELDAQGESMQVRRHLQGFSTASVDDVLDAVRDKLPSVANQKNVPVITRAADYRDASIELVDVTDELVALFDPNEQTLKVVRELRKQKPMAIEEVAKP